MKSKLEPGCKAIIVGARCKENIGKIVTCLKYLGKVPTFKHSDRWEIDQPILFTDGTYNRLCCAKTMQRIDDDSYPETEETKKEIKTHL